MLPVGNAGNISAYWMGFREYAEAGARLPTSADVGLPGRGCRAARARLAGRPNPETIATAIRIGNPASWTLAESARDESGGRIDAVTDEQILHAQRELARHDGIFVEPASAAGVAGLLAAVRGGRGPQRR